MKGKIFIVGIGPGSREHMSLKAVEVIEQCDIVIGYKTYIDILKKSFTLKNVLSTGMRKETDRCGKALEIAEQGLVVALVSSGDSGIYGMAGLMLEIIDKNNSDIEAEIIPGITSFITSASILGAPVMHDYASISLSDLLTDRDLIKLRLECAAKGDFVICLYNPKSKTRTKHIEEARDIILSYRGKDTPVGIVRNAAREGTTSVVTTLEKMLEHDIDMLTTVIIGNSKTYISGEKIITPRGYEV
ncbi:MAG: precorrin-3B C(17)-methyltransferase [Spirochaetes bacterium]|nr:precorrin-3B C(17)-methyltransferase [Spirochaetota bacterium]